MKVWMCISGGVEGPHLAIYDRQKRDGYRLAGPKAWGGSTSQRWFLVDVGELTEHARVYAFDDQSPEAPSSESTYGWPHGPLPSITQKEAGE